MQVNGYEIAPKANLDGAILEDVSLVEADLSEANFRGAILRRVDLTRAKLVGADFTEAVLSNAVLDGADLTKASLYKADLTGVRMVGANLSQATLTWTILRDADLTNATLTEARPFGADFTGTDLVAADLSGAIFERAVLRGTDLSNARLVGTILKRAVLSGTVLFGADLTDADLSESSIHWPFADQETLWPEGFDPEAAGIVVQDSARQPLKLGDRLTDAVGFAREMHHGAVRKGTQIPYLSHVLAVAALAIEDAASDPELHEQIEEISVAAVLHDVVEDTPVTVHEVSEQFGEEVARIVEACSDAETMPKPPWRERKEAYIEHLEEADQAVLCVSLADKRHNAHCIVNDARTIGTDFWKRFNAGPEEQIWYYSEVTRVLAARRPGPAAEELRRTVEQLCDLAERASTQKPPE